MNKAVIELIGNVAADATLIPGVTDDDGKVTRQPRITFAVIVNHFWKEGGNGHTSYPCTMWGPLAEKLAPSMIKGKLVCIDGLPTLYECGAVIPNTEKTVRGFNVRVDRVYLGPNSKKSQGGELANPAMLEAMAALAEESGVDIAAIFAKHAAGNTQKANEEGNSESNSNPDSDSDSDTPFGPE